MIRFSTLTLVLAGLLWFGSSRAEPVSEQNNNMEQCRCTPCGKYVSCDTLQKDPAIPLSENRPAVGKSKEAQKAK